MLILDVFDAFHQHKMEIEQGLALPLFGSAWTIIVHPALGIDMKRAILPVA